MKDMIRQPVDLQDQLNLMQADFAQLRERVASLESVDQGSGKHKKSSKKSRKKRKGKKSDPGMSSLEQVLRAATHEQLVATIVRYHKNPEQIARKIARERID